MLAILAALCVLATGAWAATTSPTVGKTAVVTDHSGDTSDNGFDLTRVTFGRAAGGQLRASITTDNDFAPTDLRSRTGPPGSICLNMWTVTVASASPPDYLLCVTANAIGDALRATIMKTRPNQLPQLVGPATLTRSSEHNVTLRFAQSAIARPATIAFSVETTEAGCDKVSCIDAAPNAPAVSTLKLRSITTATG